ncbi:pilin [Patescibacteria group bacterium]|nr:pilin [Patescibacteria group bacterium]
MNLLAAGQDVQSLFGTVAPPQGMNFGGSDPLAGLAKFISFGIQLFLIVAGMFLLLYLLWGAFDWIVSGGEKEKISKAQNKITNALIGIILVFGVLVVFNLLAGQLLGIIKVDPATGGWQLNLPTLQQSTQNPNPNPPGNPL